MTQALLYGAGLPDGLILNNSGYSVLVCVFGKMANNGQSSTTTVLMESSLATLPPIRTYDTLV
jgi:hypothetical protein